MGTNHEFWANGILPPSVKRVPPAMLLERKLVFKHHIRLSLRHHNDDNISIETIAIPAKDRRQGIGTMVMNEICDTADEKGWTLHLSVTDGLGTPMRVLIEWYQSFGFTVVGVRKELPIMKRLPQQ